MVWNFQMESYHTWNIKVLWRRRSEKQVKEQGMNKRTLWMWTKTYQTNDETNKQTHHRISNVISFLILVQCRTGNNRQTTTTITTIFLGSRLFHVMKRYSNIHNLQRQTTRANRLVCLLVHRCMSVYFEYGWNLYMLVLRWLSSFSIILFVSHFLSVIRNHINSIHLVLWLLHLLFKTLSFNFFDCHCLSKKKNPSTPPPLPLANIRQHIHMQ